MEGHGPGPLTTTSAPSRKNCGGGILAIGNSSRFRPNLFLLQPGALRQFRDILIGDQENFSYEKLGRRILSLHRDRCAARLPGTSAHRRDTAGSIAADGAAGTTADRGLQLSGSTAYNSGTEAGKRRDRLAGRNGGSSGTRKGLRRPRAG